MKKLFIAALVLVALTGCGNNGSAMTGINSIEVTMLDGRVVPCVTVSSTALSCDWENAR